MKLTFNTFDWDAVTIEAHVPVVYCGDSPHIHQDAAAMVRGVLLVEDWEWRARAVGEPPEVGDELDGPVPPKDLALDLEQRDVQQLIDRRIAEKALADHGARLSFAVLVVRDSEWKMVIVQHDGYVTSFSVRFEPGEFGHDIAIESANLDKARAALLCNLYPPKAAS